ncbi:hypothetical protein CIL05_04400 [Virgibacillus profundi]|uniref:SnoaL-like domain-containing protein n=1 Tax=Virgibacillus profundi TaxID=2024555 RepID=A0A2A2IG42_9BACI|nr:nuclear transport factor 2 family protein [Virgibacillus profundi]PAV30961.1 hypothetical protein CIL05_04400 [Virgibacillus profundi]PXY55145.1 nuclear transport factor 2 family protein [Virgibacillus profundi]
MINNKIKSGELKVICTEDCGNAPKKQQLKDFNIAFAKNDLEFLMEYVTDDIIWNIVGEKQIKGKENFEEELRKMNTDIAEELQMTNIITHGKTGAVNGVLRFDKKKNYSFCDVYTFSSAGKKAKIKEITSYVIEVV